MSLEPTTRTNASLLSLSAPPAYVNLFCVALRQMKTLTTLRMHIMNLDPMLMWWVPHVLDAMGELPLASVTLGFTFDLGLTKLSIEAEKLERWREEGIG